MDLYSFSLYLFWPFFPSQSGKEYCQKCLSRLPMGLPSLMRFDQSSAMDPKLSFSRATKRSQTSEIERLWADHLKFKGQPFYVLTPMGDRLMIPPKYVEELKNEPNERADFPATFVEVGPSLILFA